VPELGQDPKAAELADDLEKMGPIYVKLGQVFSSRGDLLPASYVKALTRLQDHNEPFSYAEVVETVEQELGCRMSKAFQEFEEKPLATASLGQVHRAILHKKYDKATWGIVILLRNRCLSTGLCKSFTPLALSFRVL